MDISWADRIDLFRFALSAALIAGLVCPLIGVFLLLRRTSFYGIALPQFAAAGVVFGFVLLPWWAQHIGLGDVTLEMALSDTHAVMNYHLAWAALFTFGGLFALVWLGRRGGSEIGRVAAAFAIANAATYFFGRLSPVGKSFVDELLQGEILGVGVHELETIGVLLGGVLVCIFVFHRDLVLVSFDREFALVLGKRVVAFETLLNVLVGVGVAAGTMTLGPTILFGLIVLPPLAARPFASSMNRFLLFSSLLGVLAVVGGVVVSFEWDFPLGASVVAVAALELLPALCVRRN
ncbi:MAG: metal ABC transporter permease [Planctomycetes bacterium]|nr:metal ABC transporter permease [Planctomycetota bacterium]